MNIPQDVWRSPADSLSPCAPPKQLLPQERRAEEMHVISLNPLDCLRWKGFPSQESETHTLSMDKWKFFVCVCKARN